MKTATYFEQMEELFREALAYPVHERSAFLRQACEDRGLREEVEALLDADADSVPFLQTLDVSMMEVLEEVTSTFVDDEAGAFAQTPWMPQVGPYRLLRELGRGGMGTVYLAERDDVEKTVALKLVRNSLAAPQTVQRFLLERRILARLKHPNIAQLLDAGMTPDQTPYFAMEYVEGESLTAYCDRRQLGVQERLALFQSVCEAVHYAHQNLVIHRDLKPSNILVEEGGTVKLLDFGIAKLMEDNDDTAGLTHTGMRMMTPRYAAPEQVRGEPVTTVTDVYALGVILYELLTGHGPYALQGRTPGDIERVICEQDPARPSTKVIHEKTVTLQDGSTGTLTPEMIGAARATEPVRLQRQLRGDLDTICLKALAKEPDQRYASVEALLEDVKRYLVGLPVQAQPSTAMYRTKKFVRRHRISMGITTAVLVLITSVVSGFTIQLAQERDRVRVAANTAESALTFIVEDVFDVADPYSMSPVRGDTVTARTLLLQGASRIDEKLAGQPKIQAVLLDKVGQVYAHLAMYEESETLLRKAVTLREELLGEEDPEVATTLTHLAKALRLQGKYEEAEPAYQRALAMRQSLFGNDHIDVSDALHNLANLKQDTGDYEAADSLYQQALAIERELYGGDHLDIASTLNNMGTLLQDIGDYDGAESRYQEALAMRQKLLGKEHPEVANSLNNMGTLLHDKKAYAEAETIHREALAMRRKLFGETHPDVANSLSNLAAVVMRTSGYQDAAQLMQEALAIEKSLLGEDHPRVGMSLHNLAATLHFNGDCEAADPHYRSSIAIYQKAHPEGHPLTAVFESHWADCLKKAGQYELSEATLLRSHETLVDTYGGEHGYTQYARKSLVSLYTKWNKPEQADHWRKQVTASS